MGRTYAGVLGPISFGIVIARTLIDGGSPGAALVAAVVALFTFAVIGYLIGAVAEKTVVEAMQMKFRTQWQANEAAAVEASSTNTQSTASNLAA